MKHNFSFNFKVGDLIEVSFTDNIRMLNIDPFDCLSKPIPVSTGEVGIVTHASSNEALSIGITFPYGEVCIVSFYPEELEKIA